MRTYQKRQPTLRHCVHCHALFESAHKRRIYCGNSCSTLAYYARKAQATPSPTTELTRSTALGSLSVVAPAQPVAPPAVTLAVNAQNLALLATAPLLADGLKQVAQFVGKLLAPTPQAGPSTWLPAIFQLIKQPLIPCQHLDWDEPRFFVPVEWRNTVFYYRAKQDLLFWQDPEGQCYQLTKKAEFEQVLSQLRPSQLVSPHKLEALIKALNSPPTPPQNAGDLNN